MFHNAWNLGIYLAATTLLALGALLGTNLTALLILCGFMQKTAIFLFIHVVLRILASLSVDAAA